LGVFVGGGGVDFGRQLLRRLAQLLGLLGEDVNPDEEVLDDAEGQPQSLGAVALKTFSEPLRTVRDRCRGESGPLCILTSSCEPIGGCLAWSP
jgi:hypothetical protein